VWIIFVIAAVCLTFIILALTTTSVSVILCVGFGTLIASIWVIAWQGSWWLADQFTTMEENRRNDSN
jgi:hypothetical protein